MSSCMKISISNIIHSCKNINGIPNFDESLFQRFSYFLYNYSNARPANKRFSAILQARQWFARKARTSGFSRAFHSLIGDFFRALRLSYSHPRRFIGSREREIFPRESRGERDYSRDHFPSFYGLINRLSLSRTTWAGNGFAPDIAELSAAVATFLRGNLCMIHFAFGALIASEEDKKTRMKLPAGASRVRTVAWDFEDVFWWNNVLELL